MRTLLLVSTAFVLVACSDSPQPTAPRSIGSATNVAGGTSASHAQTQAGGKPLDQVGFTKVTSVTSVPAVSISAGVTVIDVATCPAGTTAVGGGHWTAGGFPVFILESDMDGNNGWRIKAYGPPTLQNTFLLHAIVYCLS